jgi:hypothetical protein
MSIDGIDIKQYGCRQLKETVAAMLKYPKRTGVEYNNYAETDGIEPDVSRVIFQAREVQLRFLIRTDSPGEFFTRYAHFIAVLSAPGYREIVADSISLSLRYSTTAKCVYPRPFNAGQNLTAFHVNFIQDAPVLPQQALPTGGTARGQYRINGLDFGAFGIGSNSGYEDVLKYPGVKTPFENGNDTWLSTVRVQHKEIKLSVWQIANSKEEFLHNHAAFFFQLSRPGLQKLYIKGVGETSAYYSDCPSYEVVSWNGSKVAARFSITLVIPVVTWISGGGTNIMRVLLDSGTQKLLADEQGRVIIFN